MAVELTARHLVCSSFPRLLYGPAQTKSDSVQPLEFRGTLGYWSEFESEVRESTLSQIWTNEVLDHESTSPGRCYLSQEHYACGDEYSVQGRFGQNLGQVMSAVFKALNLDIRIGDCKTYPGDAIGTSKSQKLPDFVLITERGTLLAVGEAKTPWVHKFDEYLRDQINVRWALGQVASYMIENRLKFGFLTSYAKTIFLKLEKEPGSETFVLWHSDTIRSDTKFIQVPITDSTLARDFRNKVTTRECFLYIGKQMVSHTGAQLIKYNRGLDVSKRPKSRNAGISNPSFRYISDNNSNPAPFHVVTPSIPLPAMGQQGGQSWRGSPSNESQRELRSARSRNQLAEPETRASQLTLTDRSKRERSDSPPMPVSADGCVQLLFDQQSQRYYFLSFSGEAIFISCSNDPISGRPYIEYKGRVFWATISNGKGDQGKDAGKGGDDRRKDDKHDKKKEGKKKRGFFFSR
ncbi:hypothetical protein AJ80_06260 [Polytolypa hystricis UAMH7299]|uniref:Uncharacterized protein n=1 Tax=Polytolypa hystricis (strain UAMH7299) TaxID=1447883 RepID=A0A2B7XYH9_POLH7|nr:hypothetical protein AJ80_06260 [Polytolypa hystricis UAMH7299]